MSRAPATGLQEIAELRAALQPLDAVVPDTCWNHAELEGLPIPAAGLADAAVLVGLVPHAAGTTVLLTRRTDALRNHAGQVSFPGGRVEPDDADAIAAALRETGEEIGVPGHQISPIGLLDPLMTITGFRVLPVVAMIGIDIGIFMGGIVVVESVFGWPGIGQLAWQAIQRVDIPIIMGVTLVSACAIVLGNLLADIVAPFIDPRIKLR